MNTIITLVNMFRLKGKPEELPYSNASLIIITILFVLMIVQNSLMIVDLPANLAFADGFFSVVITYLVMYYTLYLRNKLNRLHKLFSAFLGCKLIYIILTFLILNFTDPGSPTSQSDARSISLAFVTTWILIVHAKVFQSGLDTTFGRGILWSLFFNIIPQIFVGIILALIFNPAIMAQ